MTISAADERIVELGNFCSPVEDETRVVVG